jgi:hypothetical protein
MGQARKRGNREQRIAQAKERESFSLSKMGKWVNEPVDEDLFLFCSNLYTAAAKMTMPVENPAAAQFAIEGMGTYSFTDTSFNRGLGAVAQELSEQGVDEATHFSVTYRLMMLGAVLRETELFSKWIRPGGESGQIEVAEALLRACARAKLNTDDESGMFDLADVARHATEIAARLEDRSGAKNIEGSATAA